MKVNYQNQNNCTTLSKRPKSGDKDKYQTIMNNKIQAKYKYASYFQSPNKGEDLLFIKKKFQKLKKNSNDKIKNKTTNNTNNNNNSNNNISSSYISFMSPINKNYYNKKQNNALTKFLKNQLILNSIDSSSFIASKEREREKEKEKEKVMSYNHSNNLSNILKNNISKNNKLLNNNDNNNSNINHLSNLKINYNENNHNAISNKNALSNSNIVINKISNSNFVSNKKIRIYKNFLYNFLNV